MTARARRRLEHLSAAALLVAASTHSSGVATAADFGQAGGRPDLDIAAFLLALGGIMAGVVAWARLRAERPKIVAEIAKTQEEAEAERERRLNEALAAAWGEADRLRALRAREREELDGCYSRIAELERRERELEDRVDELERELERRSA